MAKLLWTFEKEIFLTAEQAGTILFNIREGSFSGNQLPFLLRGSGNSCIITEKNSRFEALFDDGHKSVVTIDRLNYSISLQGEWWFKAVYALIEKDNKTILRASVYNAVETLSWLAQLMNKNKEENNRTSFCLFADNLEREYHSSIKTN